MSGYEMINSVLRMERGAATLLLTVVMLLTATLIVLFAASYSLMQQKIGANQYRNQKAYEAAEAGLEFGIVYLNQNSATILANPVLGKIPNFSNSSTTNVILGNGCQYSIVYSNPIAFNYQLILITSTGTSADGTGTKVIQQLVQFGSSFDNPPTNPMTIQGSVTLSGNAQVNNLTGSTTVITGSSLSMSGNADTNTATGGSNAGHTGSDVQTNVASVASMNSAAFFAQYFAGGSAALKNSANYYYTSNYANANGITGASIWVDQSASYGGNTTIGSSLSPVVLIVNGNLSVSGNFTVYGFVYVIGNFTSSGNAVVNGSLAVTGTMTGSGNDQTNFNSTILNTLKQLPSIGYYGRVGGSWKDF